MFYNVIKLRERKKNTKYYKALNKIYIDDKN